MPFDVLATGQHSAAAIREILADLGVPVPSERLQSGQGAWQETIDPLIAQLAPSSLVIVVGDTNSARLVAEAAVRRSLPVVHAEAGLRLSRPDLEPEEANRRVLSGLAYLHLAPTELQRENLLRESRSREIVVVGDFTGASLGLRMDRRLESAPPSSSGPGPWFATMHRVSNMRRLDEVAEFLRCACRSSNTPLLVCTRNDDRLTAFYEQLSSEPLIRLAPSPSPSQFLEMMLTASGCVTDSAGVQQEAAIMALPSIVMRTEVELYSGVATQHLNGVLNCVDAASVLSRAVEPGPDIISRVALASSNWRLHADLVIDAIASIA